MSNDNLKERLTDMSVLASSRTPADALQYIEELEAKLATCRKYRDAYAECDRISTHALRKAVEALDEAVYLLAPDEEDMAKKAGVYRVVTTLAELTGGKDE